MICRRCNDVRILLPPLNNNVPNMNRQQSARFAKLKTEKFYLLDRKMVDNVITMHISGSTQNIYTVTINMERSSIFCDCPDNKTRAKSQGCVCKHCLFVLYRVLRIFNGTDQRFFIALTFTPDDMERILLAYVDLNATLDTAANQTIINKSLTDKYHAITCNLPEGAPPPAKPPAS